MTRDQLIADLQEHLRKINRCRELPDDGTDSSIAYQELLGRQILVMRLAHAAIDGGLLPTWVAPCNDGLWQDWSNLAEAMEKDPRTAHRVFRRRDRSMPVEVSGAAPGTNRVIFDGGTVQWWITHAERQVEVLIDMASPSTPNAGTKPPLLTINETRDVVTTRDGKTYSITQEQARYLQILIDAEGLWVSSSNMKLSNERPDKIINKLPKSIREMITSQPGKGYLLPRE